MTDPVAWGVQPGYWDVAGRWRESPGEVVQGILRSMNASEDPPPGPIMVTVRLDHPLPPLGRGTLRLEDGAEVRVEGHLPAGVPPGYHTMVLDDFECFDLVVSPGVAPVPSERTWGFSSQLYASRSLRSWGIGDLADLAELGRWSAGLGARALLVNPLHAPDLGARIQPSPYYPSSRCFANPLYIAVGAVPGSAEATGFAEADAAGKRLGEARLIDRERVWEIKSAVLEEVFRRGVDDVGLDAYRSTRGELLELFATFCAIRESQGCAWPHWPPELRHPRSEAVREFRDSPSGRTRVRYHSWLQYLLDQQMTSAGSEIGIVSDLAVGVDPGGADAWMWQDILSLGMSVGAPPDEFATQGQDWGLPPFDPWRLRRAGYAPLIEALRSSLRHSAGLRVDHVMGLFRPVSYTHLTLPTILRV